MDRVEPLQVELLTNVYLEHPGHDAPLCDQCQGLAISPKHTSCGKMLCLNCWKGRSSCQHCDNTTCTTFAPDKFMIHALLPYHCSCPFASNGCEEVIQILHVDAHAHFCPFGRQPCGDCTIPVDNANLGFHAKFQCTERKVQCPECPDVVGVKDYRHHAKELHPRCGACRVKYDIRTHGHQHGLAICSLCGLRLPACKLGKHMADAGHVEKLLGELKVVRKQLQEAGRVRG